MNTKNGNKRPRPSYEDGELRDPRIAEMQDAAYSKEDLFRLIRRSAEQVPGKASARPVLPS